MRERERERKKLTSLFSRSSVFQRSELVGPRSKVRLLDEGYVPRGRDSSYFGYFHLKGCLAVFSALRGCLVGFFIGLPCFDPTLYLQFGTGFRLRNKENLDFCSS